MSGTMDSKKTRKLVIRLALVALYFVLLGLVLVTGRGHTILIDNRDAEDGSYLAIDGMEVSVDGGESAEYYPGDRDRALVSGQKHRIKVAFFDGRPELVKEFTVPFGVDMLILSVPKMVAGMEPFVETFVAPEYVAPPEEPEEVAEPGTEGAETGGLLPETLPEVP